MKDIGHVARDVQMPEVQPLLVESQEGVLHVQQQHKMEESVDDLLII